MRSTWLASLSFLVITTIAGLASADVMPRCKCSTPGMAKEGGLAAAMALAGAGTLLVARARRRS